ncbi:hypothetical protein V8G61_06685 [Gaetbulibacter sp. M240]|uniref:hypothetical protein n=1 Tax=Gaetbulibacter sp. M240 TaxID=3126511 RepID=UPI00374F63F4
MNKLKSATKHLYLLGLLLLMVFLQYCKSKQTASTTFEAKTFENPVTYNKDISPIMEQKCTPCHYPERGKKKLLDTYRATKNNIDDIIHRVQLAATEEDFMPFKSKKEPLTVAEIQLMKDWVSQGMPE